MAQKRYNKSHKRPALFAGFAACLVVTVCITIGIGTSFAGAGGVNTSGFGLGDTVSSEDVSASDALGAASDTGVRESTQLSNSAQRDITKGIEAIEAKEEADRIAAEEAERAAEEAAIAAAAEKQAQQMATNPPAIDLSEVDFSVGKEAFVAEWTERIDAYLAGSPLAGQGATFATAAWDNGVDPRWSPAISNTESTKGAACFLPYNAWGWGSSSFSSWEEAINTHVAGLASVYGHSITYAAAQKYCPPNYDNWFRDTLAQMQSI